MSPREPVRYGVWSGAAAAMALIPLLVGAAVVEPRRLPWIVLGWIVGAAPGVLCGVKLVRVHGVANAGFLKIMGTCMLARLFVFPAGALVALASGKAAVVAYAVGLVAGYLPTQVFETAWFMRRTRRLVPHPPSGGIDPRRSERG